ncbi:MAG: pantetheine-phosphate adenylyltransferase [Armatimonadota bacterium]|nr:pantetheine-phosphate adenylyltransferase [Armatimonadota bacterium]MDR7438334.1 pantetheine-phosphate adenylyltransferase [Armatimonadota bacterium]MDR7443344.1 pantetheine-phosphate adenylyltransferase [Armatimonadota bacterium]MDR7563488.1 pantetheine-phosphate adenylyltransferase [Armatimonadota bacterium]MDR7567125.1 pantetheine-phosphate adenylyltransferase [Armatimonadota bacterium]
MIIAVYPGTFDPIHLGHLDIIVRAAGLFDVLVVGVAHSPAKRPLFSPEERVEMIREATSGLTGVRVEAFEDLTVAFARRCGARVIVKGLRATMDFDAEMKMAMMNRRLAPEVETLFLPTSPSLAYLSSTLIKEVARLGGDVSELVPSGVLERLRGKVHR